MMTSRFITGALCTTQALFLVACSGADDGQIGPSDGEMSYGDEEIVNQGTAGAMGLDCNAIKARPVKGNDVVGVFIGQSAQNAFEAVACANPLIEVQFQGREVLPGRRFVDRGFYNTKLPGGAYAYSGIYATSGTETISVSLAGAVDDEHVIVVEREVEFGAGEQPPFDTLRTQIEQKYDLFWDDAQSGRGSSASSADGTVLTPQSAIGKGYTNNLWGRCAAGVNDVRENCGLAISVGIDRVAQNEGLARKLSIKMKHGAYAMRKIAEYERYAKAQNASARAAEVKRAREQVENAEGIVPDL